MKRIKKIITIFEIIFIFVFMGYNILNNYKPLTRIFYIGLEISAISFYHIYEKFKNKIS